MSNLSLFDRIRRHAGAATIVIAMTIVGSFPMLRPLFPGLSWLSINTTSGAVSYLLVLAGLAALAVVCMVREGESRDLEQDNLKRLVTDTREMTQALVVAAKIGLDGRPLVDALEAAMQVTVALPSVGGTGTVNAPSVQIDNNVMKVVRHINENPPLTPQAIDTVVRHIKRLILEARTGDFRLTGTDARLTHKDKDGNVIGES